MFRIRAVAIDLEIEQHDVDLAGGVGIRGGELARLPVAADQLDPTEPLVTAPAAWVPIIRLLTPSYRRSIERQRSAGGR